MLMLMLLVADTSDNDVVVSVKNQCVSSLHPWQKERTILKVRLFVYVENCVGVGDGGLNTAISTY